MNRALLAGIVIATLSAGEWLNAQSPGAAAAQLKAAVYKAEVEGDLKAAIDQFRKVIAIAGVDRALAAEAWLQIGDCYRRLGDVSQSQHAYREVLAEFTDQPKALARARERVERDRQAPAAMTLRKVFDGGFFGASVNADGQWVAHYGKLGQQLLLRNVASGSERQLDAGATIGDAKFSRDGGLIAYSRCSHLDDCELRVLNLERSASSARTVLRTGTDYGGVIDWTPDGKSIAVFVNRRADRTLQFGLLDASGKGPFRVLRTFAWGGGAIGGVFSPDGRDLALNARALDEGGKRDIILVAADATREVALVTHPGDDFALGWTPDGKHLLFGTDRNGAIGVWSQRVVDRSPQGPPALIKPNVGTSIGFVGTTRDGGLLMTVRSRAQNIEVSSVDLETGARTADPVRPIRAITDFNFAPGWSADGRSLTFTSSRRGENILGILPVESATGREINLSASLDRVASQISAAPDGTFMAYGRDLTGRYATFRIDDSGAVSPLTFHDPAKGRPGTEGYFWSADGTKVYFRLAVSGLGSIHEMDLASRSTRLVVDGQFRSISLSPDRQRFVVTRPERSGDTAVLIVGLDGQEREVMRGKIDATPQWTPDGRGLLVLSDGEAGLEFWLTDLAGAGKRRLPYVSDRVAKDFQWFRLRPDGKQIAYVVGEDRSEVWVLEHFLSSIEQGR